MTSIWLIIRFFLLTNHKDPHVPHPKELLEQRGKGEPHLQSSLELLMFVTMLFSPLCQPPVVTLALISCQPCTLYCSVLYTLHWDTGTRHSLWRSVAVAGFSRPHNVQLTSHMWSLNRDHLQSIDTPAVYLLVLQTWCWDYDLLWIKDRGHRCMRKEYIYSVLKNKCDEYENVIVSG